MPQRPRIEPMPQPKRDGKLAAAIGVSAAGLLLATIAMWEGKRNVGYFDIVGVATACYGDTKDVQVGKVYTDKECAERLERQALAHIKPVLACTPSLKGRTNQLVAAGSLAYNIGAHAYCRSTVDRRFDAGDWRGGCNAMLAWRFAGGREIRGLKNRRIYERNLCLKGL